MKEKAEIRKSIYSFLPGDIEGLDLLGELALDLRWSWSHEADKIWQQIDPDLWNLTHNPWVVLQTVSIDQLKKTLADPIFRKEVKALIQSNEMEMTRPAWFQKQYPQSNLTSVAYFSMEFMLSEALPIYSGGLGNVAGDQLKAANDLGVPVIGIGLLYQQGYFRQEIDKDGAQEALFPYNDPGQLPVSPLRQPNGEWLRLEVKLPGYSVWLRTWQVQVGRIKLYLLDSNDAANFPVIRGITSELYGGGSDLRLKQEMILGIGGWRLLNALGIQPQVCHLNEGHAAFAILERAACFMKDTGQLFDVAWAVTRAGNLFTTHTAVAAGFDCFSPSQIEHYLGEYAQRKLGISVQQLLALGRKDPADETENFNMAYLAIRGSGAVNGVSRLHGEVSRHIFQPLFPQWPTHEVPVGYITNGVHMPTWDSREADEIWTEACGKDRWLGMTKNLGQDIRKVSDERLWEMRTNASKTLIDFAREHFSRQLLSSGNASNLIERAKHLFDPDILTLGFAKRFSTYKRPNLLLHDPQRLLRLLTDPKFPVQLILAGKAHPADQEGQDLIKEWMHFIRQNGIHPPVIFLADYNMYVSENLVRGVDVWINTPRRPWEACGTSGMKVLVNGGINLSELDGWWAEVYKPEVGWALGDGFEHENDNAWDAIEAEQLYTILEKEIIPEFYNRNAKGIPTKWISRMRESMAQLTPLFSADRAVREYTEQHYLTAATAYIDRSANLCELGKQLVDWNRELKQKWDKLCFGELKMQTEDNQYLYEVQVYLNDLQPNMVRVEIYADERNGQPIVRQEMNPVNKLADKSGGYVYKAAVSATRPSDDYTARVIPDYKKVLIPLESSQILWQR
jgi:glycogen phosphorylase